MKIGQLYSYPTSRNLFRDEKCIECFSFIEKSEPFVLLEVKQLKWIQSYKVLTTQGSMGWIQIGYPEKVQKAVL